MSRSVFRASLSESTMDSRNFPLELVDHTIGYVHTSPESMKACALVCREWLPIARIHLFYSINFNQRAMGQVSRIARRFCELLDWEPSVSALIREFSISWSVMFASSLIKKVDFTRLICLEKLSLKFIPWSQAQPESIKTIQTVFSLPSLTHLVLHSHTFEGLMQFSMLLDECRLNLKTLTLIDIAVIKAEDVDACMQCFDNTNRSRVELRSLSVRHGSLDFIVPWLLHPHSPIDLTALKSLTFEAEDHVPMLRKLLGAIGPSLKVVDIISPSELISADDIDIGPDFLPNIIHLTFRNVYLKSLPSAIVLLSQLKSTSPVEQITLVVDVLKRLHSDSEADPEDVTIVQWERLDEVLDGLQLMALKSVEIIMERGCDAGKFMTDLKAKFRRMVRRPIFHFF